MSNIWHLGFPMAIGSLLFGLPMAFDMFWMGKLGSDALASVGITYSLRFAMISPVMGLSIGGGAVIARYIGAGDQARANLAMFQSLVLFFLIIGSTGIAALIFTRPLLRLLGAEERILPLALNYARIIFAGLPAIEMLATVGFLLNASGSPERSLQANIIAATTIIFLEPFLVFGLGPFPQLGIRGGAIAWVLGSALGSGYHIFILFTGRARVRLNLNSFRLHRQIMKRIIFITLPAGVQRSTFNMANAVLIRIVSVYGITAVAAYSVVIRILGLIRMPCLGFGKASAAMVGQNLGAAKPWRAEKSAWLIAILTMGAVGLSMGILSFMAGQVVSAFNAEAGVVSVGVHMIRIVAIGQIFMGLSMVMESSLGGSGDTTSPMVVNIIALWLIQLPLAYILSQTVGWGTNGIWLAITVSYMVAAILMSFRFRQGRWKFKQI